MQAASNPMPIAMAITAAFLMFIIFPSLITRAALIDRIRSRCCETRSGHILAQTRQKAVVWSGIAIDEQRVECFLYYNKRQT